MRRERNVNYDIDESLFGERRGAIGTKSHPASRSKNRTPKGAALVSSDYLSSIRGGPDLSNSSTVTMREINKMNDDALLLTPAEQRAIKQRNEDMKAHMRAAANARKEKMLQMEENRRLAAPTMSDMERIENDKNNAILLNAKVEVDENLDDVKHMNQMILYAKCATIRDMQLQEKLRMQEGAEAEERRIDLEMEATRIRNIKEVDERDRVRKEERRTGALHIIQQIQEREADRVRQQEIVEQESRAMIERIKLADEKEKKQLLVKAEEGRKMLAEVMEANNEQARAKIRAKQMEVEEDKRIAEYIRQKDIKEAAKEAELEAIHAEKEREVARLRAQQEKVADRRSAIDELRAKRYQMAADRKWREEQMAKEKKQAAVAADIAVAREVQRAEKARRMASQAIGEREEYERKLEWTKQQAAAEELVVIERHKKQNAHREDLLVQIAEHEKTRKMAREQFLTSGKEITYQMAADKRKLLAIKEQKLAQLRAAGVPEKYQAELLRKKVMVSTIH
jgi:hypothetical protein